MAKKPYQAPEASFQTAQAWETIADTCWGYGAAQLKFPDSQLSNVPNFTENAVAPYNTSGTWGSDLRDVVFSPTGTAEGGCQGGAPQPVVNAMQDWIDDMINKHNYLGVPVMTQYDTMTELEKYFAKASFNSIANTQSQYITVYTRYTPTT